MTTPVVPHSSHKMNLLAWGMICLLAGLTFAVYFSVSVHAGQGQPVMPVDDAYIHFQYAKQIALGQPYVYNPGLPPSSGATSLLYPYLLAVGYLLGFQGLMLGVWAMLIGLIALIASAWAIYRLMRLFDPCPSWLAWFMTSLFILTGSFAWHFMSGMETGLMICFTLWTLYTFISRRTRDFVIAATLLALIRPEGSLMAVIAAGVYAWQALSRKQRVSWLLIVPFIAIGVQPALNWALTGTISASGGQAKSLLSLIPPDTWFITTRIIENAVQLWQELLAGINANAILYNLPMLPILALVGGIVFICQQKYSDMLILVFLWCVLLSVSISTLDTAFWHFKRYQMPLIALLFPLMGWGVWWCLKRLSKYLHSLGAQSIASLPVVILLMVIAGWSLPSAARFSYYYAQNTQSVAAQPLAMADWLRENTPHDAVIAVHDVGMMRYYGERTTVDMVGLTTSGAADAWRNGPGAVGEFLTTYAPRPDYVAAYTTARGLNYLAATSVYGDLVASFETSFDPRYNVALGGEFQGIFKPRWTGVAEADSVQQSTILQYLSDFTLVDRVDVADLVSEKVHDYRWSDAVRYDGFPTEFYGQTYLDCILENCLITDGGRRINGEESFTLKTQPGKDMILVTRVHPVNGGTFDVIANSEYVAIRWLPVIPGHWLEIPTLIPANLITSDQTTIKIIPHTPDGHYMPYMHWAYQGNYKTDEVLDPDVTFQDGAIQVSLGQTEIVTDEIGITRLQVPVTWGTDGKSVGDAQVFVHLYADLSQPPIAQAQDQRPGRGTLPPQNWLTGVFSDDFVVDLSNISSGTYQIAIGLYDPIIFERFIPTVSDQGALKGIQVDSNRVLLGKITLE